MVDLPGYLGVFNVTDGEVQSGLNFLMMVGAFVAAVVFVGYAREAGDLAAQHEEGTTEHERVNTALHTFSAVTLSMSGGAVLSAALVPYYLGLAADLPWLIEISREYGLIFAANVAKGLMGIAAFLHIRGLLRARLGARWPYSLAAIVVVIFTIGALLPRLL